MRRMTWCTALVLVATVWPAAGRAPAEEKADPAAAEAFNETNDLLAKFRSNPNIEARQKIVDRILEIGGPAPSRLLLPITAELKPMRAHYQQAFISHAIQILRPRLQGENMSKITSLRQTALGVIDSNADAKAIDQTAGPALKQLEGLLIVKLEDLWREAPALKTERDRLMALAKFHQRCLDYVEKHAEKKPNGSSAEELPETPEDIARQEQLWLLFGIAKDEQECQVLKDNLAAARRIPPEEATGLLQLNHLRLLVGRRPLAIDTLLCDAARDHAKDMVTKKFFDHTSPVPGKKTVNDRAKRFGTTAGGENIAGGTDSGYDVVRKSWWYSPGHRMNMMAKGYMRVGLGCYETTWTMMLGLIARGS